MVKKQKYFFEKFSVQTLTRIIAVAFFAALAALSWDGWWHVSVGRDSFWIPPHVMLYLSVGVVIVAAVMGMRLTTEKSWRQLMYAISLLVLAAPLDEIWHRIFDRESITSITIIWSPPHLLLIGGLMGSMLMLIPMLQKDRSVQARYLLTAMVWGAVLQLAIALTVPFLPLAPHEIIGFWGSGITALTLALLLLVISGSRPVFASTTLAVVFFSVLYAVGIDGSKAPGIDSIPYANAPHWLFIASFLIPAVMVDITSRFRNWFRGGLVGLLWAGIFYTFASFFLDPEFQYQTNEAMAAIITAGVGGILAGIIADLQYRKGSKPVT